MKIVSTISLCLLIFFSSKVLSQDVIVRKDGEKMYVKIQEITKDQVLYLQYDDVNEILFTIDRLLIRELKLLSNWRDCGYYTSADYYKNQHNNSISINFLGLIQSTLILGYERVVSRGTSFDVQLKLIGIDDGDRDNTTGIGIDLGYKFKFGSMTKKSMSYRPRHLMYGGYLKPVVGYAVGSSDVRFSNNVNIPADFSFALLGLQFGMQWVIQGQVSIDLYTGFNYYTDLGEEFSFRNEVNFGDLSGDDNIAVSFGVRVGYLFGSYGLEKEGK